MFASVVLTILRGEMLDYIDKAYVLRRTRGGGVKKGWEHGSVQRARKQ